MWRFLATLICACNLLANSSCVEEGVAFKHRLLQAQPTWATADWRVCQEKCQQDALCKGFTFKKDSSGSGGCWALPQLEGKEADAEAISGPKSCETILTDSGKATSAMTNYADKTLAKADEAEQADKPEELSQIFLFGIFGASVGATLLLTCSMCSVSPKNSMKRGKRGNRGKSGRILWAQTVF